MQLSTLSRLLRWTIFLLVAVLLHPTGASAQGYIDQAAVEHLLEPRAESLDDIPEVFYEYYVLNSSTGNNVWARNTLFKVLGKGDVELGRQRAWLVTMLNRTIIQNVNIGDTLVIPTEFGLDFRAYSPFPRYYAGGRDFDKLFIMDKTIQAFAAYEYGKLKRWGIINTGNPDEAPTPNGRYNFNWREEYRVSSLSPPGEEWEMYWVFNFHQQRGMHVHQYEMPTGGPMSHGCVRLIDADARWVYNWADTWKTTARGDGVASGSGRILKRVQLPAHPYDVPPGTSQQEYFDRLRLAKGGR